MSKQLSKSQFVYMARVTVLAYPLQGRSHTQTRHKHCGLHGALQPHTPALLSRNNK